MNRTAKYPLSTMSVGDSFKVYESFQHCRVAASEYARKHGMVFSCRMQDDGSMIVHRCEANQATVDARGARGRRRIVSATTEPTSQQFIEWLTSFGLGSSYVMPSNYSHLFLAMQAWCELAAYRTPYHYDAQRIDSTLVIKRIK